eukprot:10531132-Alexandrium_andersonii.AAC.1
MLSAAPAGGVEGLLARLVGADIQNRLAALSPGTFCSFQRPSGVAACLHRLRFLHSTTFLRFLRPAS